MEDLPLDIRMHIDLIAGMHQKEIAEGFAKLRAKWLPPTREVDFTLWNRLSDAAALGHLWPGSSYIAAQTIGAQLGAANPFVGGAAAAGLGSLAWLSGVGGAAAASMCFGGLGQAVPCWQNSSQHR
jgi:hypothetical protein